MIKDKLVEKICNGYFADKILRPRSADKYRESLELIQKKTQKHIRQLTVEDLYQWRRRHRDSGLADSTWNTTLNHITILIKYAIKKKWLPKRFLDDVFPGDLEIKNPETHMTGYTVEQERKIFAYFRVLETRERVNGFVPGLSPVWFWECLTYTHLYTAMRVSEIVTLEKRDVDLTQRRITIRRENAKGKRARVIPIPSKLLPYLLLVYHKSTQIRAMAEFDQFFNLALFNPRLRKAKNLTVGHVVASYTKWFSRAIGFRVSSHRFRHTTITRLVNLPNAEIPNVMFLAGHKDIKTTMSYVMKDEDGMRRMLDRYPET